MVVNKRELPWRLVFVALVTIGVIVVLWIITYLPYLGLYAFILEVIKDMVVDGISIDNAFRFKMTPVALVMACILAALLFLLLKAAKALRLQLFVTILTVAIFYVVVTTGLMLTGFWLDSGLPHQKEYSGLVRVGFFFYKWLPAYY
ncbi:hypothetical protein JXM67_15095 [candidate division WOR-3 bacterium]|nr:hypothetical protein [candidate division WOR-3 bacterium]